MAYPYSPYRSWVTGDTLTAADLSNSFLHLINNGLPANFDDYSLTVAQMRSVTDPYPGAAASQSANLAGELERLRYQFDQILDRLNTGHVAGSNYWYEDPVFAPQYAQTSIINTASPYTALATDEVIICDCTSGAITVNLPTAVGISGKRYIIKKSDSGVNAVTIDGATTETIDGALTFTLTEAKEWVAIQSDNANWQRIAGWMQGVTKADYTGLVVGYAAVDSVDIDATSVIVKNSAGKAVELSSVNLTVDLTVAGVNGLRTGLTETANTGYYLFVIYNPSTATVAGFADTLATPTLPTDYSYWKLVSWCTTTAANNVALFYQRDETYLWGLPLLILTAGGATTATKIDLSAANPNQTFDVVPPNIVQRIFGWTLFNTAAHQLDFGPSAAMTTNALYTIAQGLNASAQFELQMLLESQAFYYKVNANTQEIYLTGFTFKR